MTAPSSLPAHRRRVEHPKRARALTRSIVLVVATFIGAFAVLTAMSLAGVAQDSPGAQAIGTGVLLLVVASAVYALWTYVATRIYRCPQCGGKTATVDHAHPAIHKPARPATSSGSPASG